MQYDLIKYDNTKLSTWRSCDLMGYLRHHLNLVQDASGKSAALEYGGVWHLCMDDLYTHKDLMKTVLLWSELYYPIFEQLEQTDPVNAAKHSVEMGATALKAYWEYWQDDIESMELLAVEQFFAMDLELNESSSTCPDCNGEGNYWNRKTQDQDDCRMCNGKGWIIGPMYCGKVDKVFRDKHSGLVVGMDHKTTSFLSSATIAAFKVSQQFRGYVYWLKHHSPWKDECAEYFYYDLVLKTKTKYNPDGVPFFRDSTLAQESFLQEWLSDTIKHVKHVQQSINIARATQHYADLPRQNSNSCNNFNRICSYYDLCSSPREQRATLIDQLYEIKEWNPLSEDEE